MHRHQFVRSAAFAGVLSAAIVLGACGRQEDPATPVAEIQGEALHHTDRPVTVVGCLKAGEASNTFVLTAARADGSAETATYQLIAVPDLDLRDQMRDQVGQMVQVNGTLRSQQAQTAQTVTTPAEAGNDDRTGTVGDPMVQTHTAVTINQMTVDSITPVGEECGIGM